MITSKHLMVDGPWAGRHVFAAGPDQLRVVVKDRLPDGAGFAIYHWNAGHYEWRGETQRHQ